jgi:Zn-dependent protease with chaperone function
MSANLLALGIALLSWSATYLVHSTLLMAGVWGFLKLARHASHELREVVWKTALVGGLLTASCQMLLLPSGVLGGLTWNLPAAFVKPDGLSHGKTDHNDTSNPQTRVASESEAVGSDEVALGDSVIWMTSDDRDTQTATADFHDSIAPSVAAEQGAPAQVIAAARAQSALAPWLVVVLVAIGATLIGLLRAIWQSVVLARKLARCTPVDDGLARELLDELRRLVPGTPPVRLLAAANDIEPAALGVRQWTIVLPSRALADLSVDELRSLLAHELAHLARGDAAWLWISRCVCSCLAFQPLNHFARREWQRAAEYLCDNWAIHRTGSPLALARCLTEIASWRLARCPAAVSLPATGRKSGLVDRIERLLEARPQTEAGRVAQGRRWRMCLASLGLMLMAWSAPRIQIIAAAQDASRQTAESRREEVESAVLDGQLSSPVAARVTETATPDIPPEQTTGQAAESPATSDPNDPSTKDRRAVGTPRTTRQMLSELDRDLAALEAELQELEPLLRDAESGTKAAQLAARLRDEVEKLRQRRTALQMNSQYRLRGF